MIKEQQPFACQYTVVSKNMRVYAGEGFLLLLFLFTDKIPLTSGKIILLSLAVYPQETDYPLNNSRQTDNTSLFENGTVLILGEQSA